MPTLSLSMLPLLTLFPLPIPGYWATLSIRYIPVHSRLPLVGPLSPYTLLLLTLSPPPILGFDPLHALRLYPLPHFEYDFSLSYFVTLGAPPSYSLISHGLPWSNFSLQDVLSFLSGSHFTHTLPQASR